MGNEVSAELWNDQRNKDLPKFMWYLGFEFIFLVNVSWIPSNKIWTHWFRYLRHSVVQSALSWKQRSPIRDELDCVVQSVLSWKQRSPVRDDLDCVVQSVLSWKQRWPIKVALDSVVLETALTYQGCLGQRSLGNGTDLSGLPCPVCTVLDFV